MKTLEVSGLRKNYGKFVLGPIDLELEAGSMNGLVGPNASGKSTLFRCIIGTVRRSAGTVRVAGADAAARSGAGATESATLVTTRRCSII
jgi:ABC-2 type transport system ATP-binding protein